MLPILKYQQTQMEKKWEILSNKYGFGISEKFPENNYILNLKRKDSMLKKNNSRLISKKKLKVSKH